MKNFELLPIAFLFLSATISAQVGVNTTTPNTTMDVSAKRDSGGNITDNTQFIGLQAPRLTRAELAANTATYGANQQGAQIYITDVSGGTATGQRVNITTTGYYTFDGTLWQRMQDTNIYTGDGTLTGNRILTHAGKSLTFTNIPNSGQKTVFLNNVGVGIQQDSGAGTRSDISLSNGGTYQSHWFSDTNSAVQFTATNSATSLLFNTTSTTASAPIIFSTSNGGNTVGTEKMRITGTGNIGINTSTPTEKLDNAGITRLRTLPLNGATNAIYTTSGGTASANQDQTFTATRTVVADANGVLGYVTAMPSDAGTSRAFVIANVPGTQNIGGQFIPNAAIGQFTNESLDIYNAWTNNVFTVPVNQGGVYIFVMQDSNTHTSTGTATPTWHTMAYYEISTDGGTNWSTLLKHTYADLAGTIVDNGNTLYWTGFLNAGDKVRVRFSCNATTDNIVNYGGLSITKLAQ